MRRISPRDMVLYLLVILMMLAAVSTLMQMDQAEAPEYSDIRAYFLQRQVESFTLQDNTLTLTLRGEEGPGTGSTITYQEIVTILSSVSAWASMDGYELSQEGLPAAQYADYYQFDDWARAAARSLGELGALVGDLAPTDNATREVAAGMLCTLMERISLIWD